MEFSKKTGHNDCQAPDAGPGGDFCHGRRSDPIAMLISHCSTHGPTIALLLAASAHTVSCESSFMSCGKLDCSYKQKYMGERHQRASEDTRALRMVRE